MLDAPLTVLQNLRCRAALYGITGKAFSERIDGLCGLLGLFDILNRPVRKLSGGQRRRVEIARVLLCPGGAVILDEPFTGLDTAARDACAEVVLDLLDGRMLLLATHDVADAQALDVSDIITL